MRRPFSCPGSSVALIAVITLARAPLAVPRRTQSVVASPTSAGRQQPALSSATPTAWDAEERGLSAFTIASVVAFLATAVAVRRTVATAGDRDGQPAH